MESDSGGIGMSRFILHTKAKRMMRRRYLMAGLACLVTAGIASYTVHSIGTARAKSRETVLIYTEEEFVQYLIDAESEEYNLNGRYQLEEDLDLSWLEYSIGTNLEPFTGKLSGNGHVINGLERPLFGVLKKAVVEDLFLSHASIGCPFTYSDGEIYVDGYGALAAYAVDSTIRNCGMEGRIDTASPSEAEYLLAKASPSDADEWSGPGVEGPGINEEILEESGQAAGGNEAGGGGTGPGAETGTEPEKGPGVEGSGEESSPESSSEEVGPGVESGSETGMAGTEETKAPGPESGSINSSNNTDNAGNTDNVPGGTMESTGSQTPESDNPSSHPSGGEQETGKDDGTKESSEGSSPSGTDKEQETQPAGESNPPVTDAAVDKTEGTTSGSTSAASGGESSLDSSTGDSGTGGNLSSGSHLENNDSSAGALSETIGYLPNERHQLMMKVSAVMDSGMEELLTASPSDATPSDAQESTEESHPGDGNSGEHAEAPDTEEIEYIGNPEGDIYILVTAERVTVGGLIAQAAGETRITSSFSLVTIGSRLEGIGTYAGGIFGILGEGTRVENSYVSGLVDSDDVSGGFAALNEGVIENSFSTVTIGESGFIRGAFAALGGGRLTGCVYDGQMACAGDIHTELQMEEETEFHLKELQTIDMTGAENEVPGNWRKTDNAYPQLEYFSASGNESIADCSKMSAIALALPEGMSLKDALAGYGPVLPSEIDGGVVQWEAEGAGYIDGENRIQLEPGLSVSRNDVPSVGSQMKEISEERTAEETTDSLSDEIPESSSSGEEPSEIQLRATMGTLSRNFTLQVQAAAASADYVTWGDVGEAIYTDAVPIGADYKPELNVADGYYEIKTPEAFACFAYMVNNIEGGTAYNARLMNDIDLTGTVNNWTSTHLVWTPIANDSTLSYTGIFDGNNHKINHLKMDGTGVSQGCCAALFSSITGATVRGIILENVDIDTTSVIVHSAGIIGVAFENYLVEECGLESGSITAKGAPAGIMIESRGAGTISKCYNKASITIHQSVSHGVGAGIVSRGSLGRAVQCYNWGKVSCPRNADMHVAGIWSFTYNGSTNGKNVTVDSCYNAGTILLGSQTETAGERFAIIDTRGATVTNCYFLSGSGNGQGTPLSDSAMKSWALPFALNGQKMDGVWQYREGEYPSHGTLQKPESWAAVGQGGEDGLILSGKLSTGNGSDASPYQIANAEQLAAFAVKANSGNTSIYGTLTADIDLTGTSYTGTESEPILWSPIGSYSEPYTGTFDGSGHTISRMRAAGENYQGLFGVLGDNAVIKKTSISDSRVEVEWEYAGGIAGAAGGTTGVVITECGIKGALAGKGSRFGGCVGGLINGAKLTLDGCYNEGDISVPEGYRIGGVFGSIGAAEYSADVTIRNCMNRGTVSGKSAVGGIAGSITGANAAIKGCYNAGAVSATLGDMDAISYGGAGGVASIENCLIEDKYVCGAGADGIIVKTEVLGTWVAAWRLNGGSLKQPTDLSWTYVEGGSYPVLNTEGLASVESWEPVGEALEYGLIKDMEKPTGDGNVTPYQITTPEQLAWFAYQVNRAGKPESRAVLVNDIDMKAAESSYITDGRLNWLPIGADGAPAYQGIFESRNLSDAADTRKIYEIRNLYVSTTGTAGLFGTVSGGNISRIGVTDTSIKGSYAGGITGNATGAATIAQCYNRRTVAGRDANVSGSVYSGGIVGQIDSGVTVRDCYTLEMIIYGERAGGIVGSGPLGTVRSCYSALGEWGNTAGDWLDTTGLVNGDPGNGSGMSQCYTDSKPSDDSSSPFPDNDFVSRLDSTGNAQLRAQTAGLNTVNGVQRIGEDRIWYTSLASEATKGFPTLVPPVKMISLGEVTPADDASGASGVLIELGASETIPDARLRYAGQETAETETVSLLSEWKTEYYNTYGSINANGKIGLAVMSGDMAAMLKPEQMSLENPVQNFGTISGLSLYTGAAYTYPAARDILVELASGTERYEIRFTIKGVTSKKLEVDLPAGVAMEDVLMPDGTEKTAYSVDTAIQNSQSYPMEGKILKAAPISKAGYQALKPIARTTNYGSGQIYNAGVKLGITNPKTGTGVISGDLYYNPDTPDINPWMTYQLKGGGGTLPYRYFLKYKSDPYYDSDHPNFGYTISYQFGVMVDDYNVSAGAIAGQ